MISHGSTRIEHGMFLPLSNPCFIRVNPRLKICSMCPIVRQVGRNPRYISWLGSIWAD